MLRLSILLLSLSITKGALAQNSLLQKYNTAFETQQSTPDYTSWAHSPNRPEALLRQALTLDKSSPQEVCLTFSKMPLKKQLLFYSALKNSVLVYDQTCQKKLFKPTDLKIHSLQTQLLKKHKSKDKPKPHRFINIDTTGGPVFYHADLPKRTIALTFDDGPHPENTEQLLKALKMTNTKANFFSLGKNIRRYPDIVKKISEEGHYIGNHSWSHKQMSKQKFQDAISEIDNTFKALEDLNINLTPYFRFPYGDRNGRVTSFLKSNDVGIFYWNIDTLDWKYSDPDFLLQYALKKVEEAGHGIVLFHDIQPQTYIILPAFISELQKRGYEFVSFKTRY